MSIYNSARAFLGSTRRALRFHANRFRSNGQIFDQIYAKGIWGGKDGEVYSGNGSDNNLADAYVRAVIPFLKEVNCETVVDIGCGDFRIGSRIAAALPNYIGADVSNVVIEHNKRGFRAKGVGFVVCDAERDPLPSGDACLVRQVLQHLSNRSVKIILERLMAKYRYVVVTEHLPSMKSFKAFNIDKPSGKDIRVYYGSGLYIDRPPFNVKIDRVLLDLPMSEDQCLKSVYAADDPLSWETVKTMVIKGSAQTSL